ncbi:caspase domain-containing protein [Chloroflexota bacterium]
MVKYFKYVHITLVALIISFALVQIPNNKAYAESNPVEYWAVIVGVADYLYFDSAPLFPKPVKGYDLVYSDDDAIELADQLSSIWGADHIKLLVDSQATKSSIQDTITVWLDLREEANDVVMFYFSGHGQQDSNSKYTIWPYDTLANSDRNEIQDDILDSWLRCLESSQQIIIIDSCNSGGFVNELYKYGRIVITSSLKDEDSHEKPTLSNSIFTYFFLDAFNNLDNVDDNNDNSISIQEVFNWAESKTVSFTKTRFQSQNPKICDSNYKQISLMGFVRNNNQIPPYVTCLITVATIVFSVIVWNKYLSLKKL